MTPKVEIGKNAKVFIKWKTTPIEWSDEAKKVIASKFAKKYGIEKKNITVVPEYGKNAMSAIVPNNESGITNIQDPLFQQSLFKPFLEEKGIVDYDYDKIIEIDNTINSKIDYERYDKHKYYSVKWIKWSNFMSYGEDNFFDFTTLKGLTLLQSEPANQGGKSTFCLDLLRFLLFGKVTSRENDWTLGKVFNLYLPEATDCVVEGCISIDGDDYVIKRTVSRPQLKKRSEKSKASQKIQYYKIVDNAYVELLDEDSTENERGVSTTETNKLIKEAIGNESDFDLMICVNSDNLKKLISLKDTERGRLITRWIGLLPLEEKDKIAREMFNKTITPSLLMNKYNKEDLKTEVERLTKDSEEREKNIKVLTKKHGESEKRLAQIEKNRDVLLQSKRQIDPELTKTDVATVKQSNETLKEQGLRKVSEKETNEKALKEVKDITFDEENYKAKIKEDKDLSIELNNDRNECRRLKEEIEALKKGEYCPTCGAKLKGVDNTEKINQKQKKFDELAEQGKKKKEKSDALEKEIKDLEVMRQKYQEKTRLELVIQKNEVDLENLRAKMRENNRLLKDISANEEAIANNNRIDAEIRIADANKKAEEEIKNNLKDNIDSEKLTIKNNGEDVKKYNEYIAKIESEEKEVRSWKQYLDIIGKNGISKIVLRGTLPLINGELKRLLSDVCDFDVEVGIDESNDVAFYKIHDNVVSSLGSGSGFEQTVASLALRSVLSEISTFSKPCFVVFDEILGGVADENYDSVKKLYDKIAENYEFVLQITHLKAVIDWHNSCIIVKKKDNVSYISRK